MKIERKTMKPYLAVVCSLILALCLMLTGCKAGSEKGQSDPGQSGDGENKLQVVATIFPAYDFARQVGGDQVSVQMLLSPGEELHSYEPSPKDIIAITECDVFIYVGGESDTWVDDILDSIDTSRTTIIAMMDIVEALEEETIEGMDTGNPWAGHNHDHSHDEDDDHDWVDEHDGADNHDENDDHDGFGDNSGTDDNSGTEERGNDEDRDQEDDENHDHGDDEDHDHGEYDEHVWTSPVNAKLITERIADAFCAIDPENEFIYRENEAAYVSELETLAAELLEIREQAVRTTIIVGDRFPFRYLAEFMDIEYYAAFPGCAEETEPSAKTVAFLIDKVKEEQIPVVFYGEFSSHLMAERICEEAGGEPLLLHSCHNVTKAEFEAGVTYLDLMWVNAENLRAALCTIN